MRQEAAGSVPQLVWSCCLLQMGRGYNAASDKCRGKKAWVQGYYTTTSLTLGRSLDNMETFVWSQDYTVEPLYNGHFGTSHFWVIFAVI